MGLGEKIVTFRMRGVILRLFFETDSFIVSDIGIVLVFLSDDLQFVLTI